MYAVIFRATMKDADNEYSTLASKLRDLAFSKYGCIDFTAVNEGDQEVAISYWNSEEEILAWKSDPLHKYAQEKGQKKWYSDYSVEVVNVVKSYKSP